MEELAGNRYNFKSDIDNLKKQFDSKEYKEDEAIYTKNLFIVLGKITNENTITSFLERKVEYRKLSTATYLFICDVVKVIETNEYVNFSKYSDVIDVDSKSGKVQKPLNIKVKRNRETEFVNLLNKLEISGMLSLLNVLADLERA